MDADLIVIGNGVVGLSAALACRHRDPRLRVIVVGPSNRRGAATPAAAAMLAAASEARPSTFEDPATTAWIELLASAVDSWPDWVRDIADRSGVPSGLVPRTTRGMVVVGDEVDEGFDAIQEAATRLGIEMSSGRSGGGVARPTRPIPAMPEAGERGRHRSARTAPSPRRMRELQQDHQARREGPSCGTRTGGARVRGDDAGPEGSWSHPVPIASGCSCRVHRPPSPFPPSGSVTEWDCEAGSTRRPRGRLR